MPKLEALLAYFRTEVAEMQEPTRADLRRVVEESGLPMKPDQAEEIIRILEESFDVQQQRGATVKSEHKPWLKSRSRDGDIDFFYWNRLKKYYLQQGKLPPHVVSILDQVTDEVLDYCGNPNDEGAWSRRGMVMGHVQSGKTTNYASLICKAADSGYKIIILLAGITNSLRRQTQERLDETFIGKKSLFQKAAQETLGITNFSEQRRFPAYGTTRDRDFSKTAAATYGVTLAALKEPIIFVTKKNKATLENLRDWVQEQSHGRPIHDALLLVDDEADNASVNTANRPDRTTAINAVIREILGLFERSSYVGYTATPFANIFIDPDTEDEMLGDDLFPRHFITALDPPSNYVGAGRVFRESGDLRDHMVRLADDYGTTLPLKHKKDCSPPDLPESLKRAVRVFVLSRAVRVLRGQGSQHCSMMVNVSRFNDVQDRVRGLIYTYLDEVRNAIVMNAGLGSRGAGDPVMKRLRSDFTREYETDEENWDSVRGCLVEAVSTIEIRTVNMRGGGLDYSQYDSAGLHVIAVGGLALSRGLTLEGLTVSYILRNASASDTLMQMARWFGYRPGYEDLCRLYLPQESANHYEFITEAIEELRAEIKRMETERMTPQDFGLRVRHSPAAIRVTAANKMRSARKVVLAQDYQGRHIEGYALVNDEKVNASNREQVKQLLVALGEGKLREEPTRHLLWQSVPAAQVFPVIKAFEFAPAHPDLGYISGQLSLFTDYVGDRLKAECALWDVVMPLSGQQGRREGVWEAGGRTYTIRRREHGRVRNGAYRVTAKNKVANPGDEKLGLSYEELTKATRDVQETGESWNRACSLVRRRPLLMLHVFSAQAAEEEEERLKLENPAVSLSFCMPRTTVPAKEKQYQVNQVYLRQLEETQDDADEDEEYLDEAQYG